MARPLKKEEASSQELFKRYCKLERGNPSACPGECLKCMMEFLMFPDIEEV
jgi:hypothetical protein